MGYNGYSIVGDRELNDFWKEQMEKGVQKEELKSRVHANLQEANAIFKAYLKHGRTTASIPDHHDQILNKINHHFDGKAKKALDSRFADNTLKMGRVNMEMQLFIESFKI
ncbi:hypothetical protein [Lentibacillus sp.]|uniref:hypothetical protein n=1 Tax=Lentibacillus sp. TaxID=1925746 RepID=UPI002B4ACF97|nr:hypothetical protein [Lentibacillus sp.]HLS08679.1 hypothetical protein [Lentibacillus sp.]